MNDMGIAIELMAIGIVTVFLILSLVVLLGKLIIIFVNRFIPGDQEVSFQSDDVPIAEISSKKLAVIISAVAMVTKGTGRVIKIEKI